MLSVNSPLLNIPVALDRKQAVFLDGMRHAAQIVDMSYRRLCQALTHIALGETSSRFAHVFLDVWALIDAADRFRSLWELQPNAATIPHQYSPSALRSRLQDIRNVRNVSAHIAQKIDQIVSLNSSVLGAISWVSLLSHTPLRVKTYFIRPGIMHGSVLGQFAMPSGEINFTHDSGCISVYAGRHEANLSEAYEAVRSTVEYAEEKLKVAFQGAALEQRLPADMLGSAELDTSSV